MLENEEEDLDMAEVIMQKKSIKDYFPVHIGNAILQYAKLHMLE